MNEEKYRSPLFIRVALHYYYSPEPWDETSPAASEVEQTLMAAGLLEEKDGFIVGTEGLEVYVKALMRVPLPVQKWVMP